MLNYDFKNFDLGKVIAATSLLFGICTVCYTKHSLQKEDTLRDKYVPKVVSQSHFVIPGISIIQTIFAMIFNQNEDGQLRKNSWNQIDFFCLVIGFFGVFLRTYSMRTMGELFTFQVGIRRHHKLAKTGAYKLVRNPSYTGLMLGWQFFVDLEIFICCQLFFRQE
eukprot:TRINITY_DN17620_c0_g1_i3.p3 TRINITY_DN17620_c0_g1~~TRINITY_DN17620_c0_g1_i3.p3  ORF type:complete len:165 (-),score=2.36 TRINITY_DN17620_c0_g1_i3:581-1075(-)